MAEGIDIGVDHYADVREIGRGGFSTVYAATDARFDRPVAIKVLNRLDDESDRRRFDRECRIMGRLSSHPNVTTVHDAGYTPDERPYLVMELVDGGSLADLLTQRGAVPWPEAVTYAIGVCDALAQAHAEGILHRDVKPENILLSDGSARLTDFGIAYLRDSAGATSTKISASWLHTPPETFENQRDERADVYSLGSTLYTLIVGTPPFWRADDESLNPLMYRLLHEPPPALAPALAPPELGALIQASLAKDPAERPQSAEAFALGLRRIVDSPRASQNPAAAPTPGWAPPVAGTHRPSRESMPAEPTVLTPSANPGAFVSAETELVATQTEVVPVAATASSNRTGWLLGAMGAVVAVVLAGLVIASLLSDSDGGTTSAETDDDLDAGSATPTDADDDTASTASTSPDSTTTTSEVERPATSAPAALAGTTVSILGPELTGQTFAMRAALDELAAETGMTVDYVAVSDWRSDLAAAIAAGDPPDLVLMATPSDLARLAAEDSALPLPVSVEDAVFSAWPRPFADIVDIDGTPYAVPVSVDVKSLVWYQPARFDELGVEVPQSWSDLEALTEQLAGGAVSPWCVGIESGSATGWPFTDWVEDVVLGNEGVDVYDGWVAGDIPFSDPRIVGAFDDVGDLWATPDAVDAAGGSIATTGFEDSGPPLVEGRCLMHRQASFFEQFMPEGTALADGSTDAVDIFAFPTDGSGQPIVVAGTMATALADRPEVWAVMEYLGSTRYADSRQRALRDNLGPTIPSGFLSAAAGGDPELYVPIEQAQLDIITNASVVRFDASDQMPSAVGAGSFWANGTAFVNGDVSADEAAAAIDASWPR